MTKLSDMKEVAGLVDQYTELADARVDVNNSPDGQVYKIVGQTLRGSPLFTKMIKREEMEALLDQEIAPIKAKLEKLGVNVNE